MNISINYFKTLNSLYHSSNVNYAAIHKTFRKVLSAGTTKKRNFKYQGIPTLTNVTDLTKSSDEGKRHSTSKRASMLNKMFMRYITDLIINGNHWEEYAQNGIEINRIEVSPDYMKVNIFWISKEKNKDEAIQSFLSDNAYTLRHELSQLRVMGVVPPLSFIKDKHQSELLDLDHRISIADYGIDYEPSAVSRMKHQLELYSSIDDKFKSKLENVENDEEEVDVDLPEMPQNIFGLDYVGILNRQNGATCHTAAKKKFIASNQKIMMLRVIGQQDRAI
ncbi:hypothetical protein WA026_002411 [Henosepilachna vigintioctopunctata]|uniref:Ribosome-binding factor A, mitochondrial n=1 Tax=Henosepilachna vigintioctopunctata TaxID=420089 RepID=A0AAW1U1M8_9CUCU